MKLSFSVLLNPLTPETAYWHACTGTPYEEVRESQELRYDQHCLTSMLYYIGMQTY